MAAAGACASCGASIMWCVSSKGTRMPVDPTPVADGNVILDGEGRAPNGELLPRAIVLGKMDAPLGDPERYVSHFVSCPDARGWRR